MKWSRILAVCSIAALVYIGCALGVNAWRRAHFTPFNDPLLDKLARMTVQQLDTPANALNALGQSLNHNKGQNATNVYYEIDFDRLRDWETDFAADPRYWELRSSLAIDPANQLATESGDSFRPSMLRFRLWSTYKKNPQLALALCDAVIKEQDENSYGYYAKCDLLIYQGRYEEALTACRQGNAAKGNNLPLPPQLEALYREPAAIQGHYTQAAAGAWLISTPLPDFISSKKVYAKVGDEVAQGRQLELADALWTRACREAAMHGSGTLDLLVAIIKPERLLGDPKSWHINLDGRQLAEYEVITAQRKLISGQIQDLQEQFFDSPLRIGWDPTIGARLEWQREQKRLALRPQTLEYIAALDHPPVQAWARGELAGFLTPQEAAQRAPAALAEEAKRQQQRAKREERKRANQQAVTAP